MSNNNYQGGRPPRKEKINEWTGQGTVKPKSGNDGDEIKFFPFKNGGGAIHITLVCSEVIGADEQGNPKNVICYIPVNVMTNKNITEQQLRSVRSGMKVKVVGKLQVESYNSKTTGNRVTSLVVNAFVFEVIAMPQQGYAPQPPQGAAPAYGGYPGYGAPVAGAPAGIPQGAPQYGTYPGYAPAGAPVPGAYPPAGAPQQYPGYPGYAPAGAPAPGAYPPAGMPPQGGAVPPYYRGPAAPAGAPAPGGDGIPGADIGDLPDA